MCRLNIIAWRGNFTSATLQCKKLHSLFSRNRNRIAVNLQQAFIGKLQALHSTNRELTYL